MMVRHGIELDSAAIREFCRRWRIKELAVFGSVLRDDFRPGSDVDFLADFQEDSAWDLSELGEMRDELSAIVGHPVDLLTRLALDSSRNWLFRKIVRSSVETVYAT